MSDTSDVQAQHERAGGRAAVELRGLLLAGVVVACSLVLLNVAGGLAFGLAGLSGDVAAVGHSLEAVVRSPSGAGAAGEESGPRITPASSVIFYGGYFCGRQREGRRVRLVLASRELRTLIEGSSTVVGPFLTKAHARGAC